MCIPLCASSTWRSQVTLRACLARGQTSSRQGCTSGTGRRWVSRTCGLTRRLCRCRRCLYTTRWPASLTKLIGILFWHSKNSTMCLFGDKLALVSSSILSSRKDCFMTPWMVYRWPLSVSKVSKQISESVMLGCVRIGFFKSELKFVS